MNNRVTVKTYSYVFKILLVVYVVALFVVAFVFFILSQNTADKNLQFRYDTINFSCAVLWIVSIALVVIPMDITMRRIEKNLKHFLDEKEYDDAIEYLADCAKKRHIRTISQLILYYLGYVELYRDNIDNAVYYLKQILIKRCNGYTIYCAEQTLGFLYIVFMITKNEEFNDTRQLYLLKRDKFEKLLSKNTKPNVNKIDKLYRALRHFEAEQPVLATEQLVHTPYIDIPIINRFYDETHKEVG